jgi:transcriptional regulator with XRE-family HTH domain
MIEHMKKETVSKYLLRRLDTTQVAHCKIASESGIAQATVSRISLRKCSPRLDIAEKLLAWFERHDKAVAKSSASGLTKSAGRQKVSRSSAASAALG